ncbi:hypothetical protein [Arthrobacter sp. SDTb3-6]|uniref:hypothetical protein n=2 Tax=unclassified Arthrobacter TaxID=235627 RepID=UPI00210DEDB3|nr:hypothetical protein [Arthrobacter sp. SDTb3-6]
MTPAPAHPWTGTAPLLWVRGNDAHPLHASGLAMALPGTCRCWGCIRKADAGYTPATDGRIIGIIDGHDSRPTALTIEDRIVQEADKTRRLAPDGLDTVMDWFGLDRAQALQLCSERAPTHRFTEGARTIEGALIALESITVSPQMRPCL